MSRFSIKISVLESGERLYVECRKVGHPSYVVELPYMKGDVDGGGVVMVFHHISRYRLFQFQIKAPSSLVCLRLLKILIVCLRLLNPRRLDGISDLKLELLCRKMFSWLDFPLLMIEEADHVVLEGIAALIITETLLMPRVNGIQGRYPCTNGETVAGITKRVDPGIDSVTYTAVHGKTSRVAQGGRAEDRQHQVRPGVYSPVAKSLAEILVVPLQTELCSRIKQAAKTQGTVCHEAS